MSDTSLRERPAIYPGGSSRQIYDKSPSRLSTALPSGRSNRLLSSLPCDILYTIAGLLEPDDVLRLGMTCKFLRDFAQSRTIWLRFAADMLDACQPLPLIGFQRIKDISTPELIKLLRNGHRMHYSWTGTDPKLIRPYRCVAGPNHEDIVWLSPITSRYILCCTRTGKVLCWDIPKGECVATWSSGADWEIWKCRVEFEERVVYFAMAKRRGNGFGTDFLGTDCQLVALHFPGEDAGSEDKSPFFNKLSSFCFPGRVMFVYLLDPLKRILSAYIWLERTNHLGLYVLLDWDIPLYVFLDTGISCDPMSREWSCIGYDPINVVIHLEEEARAYQFFYPYSFLHRYATRTPPRSNEVNVPLIPPPRMVSSDFTQTENPFEGKYITQSSHFVRQWWPMVPYTANICRRSCTIWLRTMTVPHPAPEDPPLGPNDPPPGTHLFTIGQHYFSTPLRKEQLHWWYIREPFEIVCYPHSPILDLPMPDEEGEDPLLPDAQQVEADWAGEATELVADVAGDLDQWADLTGDPPQFGPEPAPEGVDNGAADADPEGQLGLAVPVPDPEPEFFAPEQFVDVAVVPLVAVDFGCAVWIEYVSFGSEDLRVRYVTFPSVYEDRTEDGYEGLSKECDVHTLEIPPEIDLKQVSHIMLDQAQRTIFLGMRRSNVYILRYE